MTHHEADRRGVTDYGDTEDFHTDLHTKTFVDTFFLYHCHVF